MIKIANFNFKDNSYEEWFENFYLKSLELINKKLSQKDFEGVISNKNGEEIALFELKLVTMPNIQEEVNNEFERNKNQSFIPFPKQNDIKKELRSKISKAINQLLKKEKKLNKNLPNIIFIIRNTPDFNKEDLIDAIKDTRLVVFNEHKKPILTFSCDKNENKSVLDLFNNEKISGLICITLEPENELGDLGYSVEIILNKNSKLKIPDIFLQNKFVRSIQEI